MADASPTTNGVGDPGQAFADQATVISDSFVNFLSGLGVPGRDKAASSSSGFVRNLYNPTELVAAYEGNWVARKTVDIPAFDATREWREWQAESNAIEAIEEVERFHNVPGKVEEAIAKSRLFGGGALVMGVDQGRPDQPLQLDKIKKGDLKFLLAVSRHDLGISQTLVRDVMSPLFGKPDFFIRRGVVDLVAGDSLNIHPSRVIPIRGLPNMDPYQSSSSENTFWGTSVLANVLDTVKDTSATLAGVASLVQESKIDIIKLPQLSKLMGSEEYRNRLTTRFSYANVSKSIINALLLDKDEEWERVNVQFGSLPDVMKMFLLVSSAAADIPATRFMAQSPAGLSATGESDLVNYYDHIKAIQKMRLGPALSPLDEVLLRSALGKRDPSIHYAWKSLWQMPPDRKAIIDKSQAEVFQIDINAGILDPEALRIGRQNQLIEASVYPGLEQALEKQDQLGLESMLTPEEQEELAQEAMEQEQDQAFGQQVAGGLPIPDADSLADSEEDEENLLLDTARLVLDLWSPQAHPRGGEGTKEGGKFIKKGSTGTPLSRLREARHKLLAKQIEKIEQRQNEGGPETRYRSGLAAKKEAFTQQEGREPNEIDLQGMSKVAALESGHDPHGLANTPPVESLEKGAPGPEDDKGWDQEHNMARKAMREEKSIDLPEESHLSLYFDEFTDTGVSAEEILAKKPGSRDYLTKIARMEAEQTERTGGKDSMAFHKDKDGHYTPERQAVHDKIMAELFAPDKLAEAKQMEGPPQFTLLGGRGGSGKSFFTKSDDSPVQAKHIVVDSDWIKERLPDYKGWNAGWVHRESAEIAQAAISFAREKGLNVLYDATLASWDWAPDMIQEFKGAGYRVEGYYMFLPPQMAAEKALARGMSEGRHVPIDYVLGSVTNEKSFDRLSREFEHWEAYTSKDGFPPKRIQRKAEGGAKPDGGKPSGGQPSGGGGSTKPAEAGSKMAASPAQAGAAVSTPSEKTPATPSVKGGNDAPTRGAEAGGLSGRGELSGGEGRVATPGAPDLTTPLSGLPTNIKIPGHGTIQTGPHGPAREAALNYTKEAGIDYKPPTDYAKVDPERAGRIATEYDRMKHDPQNPEVKAAYDAMIKETIAQWQAIEKTGLDIDWIDPKKGDPYAASPRLATEDVRRNNHLWVFPTQQGFGSDKAFDPKDNPLLNDTGIEIKGHKLQANDVFRIVHDYFGHIKEGNGFRADGEENAWRSHSAMYTPEARRAMTTETRGQNSWVNYGPHGEKNRKASATDTVFADQKIGLLPDWVVSEASGQEPDEKKGAQR